MNRRRDLTGYGRNPPALRWPGNAGVAVNFVINIEEGSEYSIAEGDGRTEAALIEVRAPRVPSGQRDLAAESMYEYGSRVGFWRIHDLFTGRGLPLTVFASAQALERVPAIAEAIAATDWDVCAHGWRWIEHYLLDEDTEREHIARAHASIAQTIGRPPKGWYCRYAPSENTRRLVAEHGGFLYDSDAYNDDLPYWIGIDGAPHLVVPYSMVTNDAKFLAGDVYGGQAYAQFLIDSLDVLRREGSTRPRMMSVGLHGRITGHPGRFAGLERFVDHVAGLDDIWICGRQALAEHFAEAVPAPAASVMEPVG